MHLPINPPAFAVAGMAGVIASTTGAAVTAIVMIFEMTLDYQIILPMTITAAVSYGIRRFWFKDSVYTLKLTRMDRPVNVHQSRSSWPHWFLIEDDGKLTGVIEADKLSDFLRQNPERSLSDAMCRNFEIVEEHTAFFKILSDMRAGQAELFLAAWKADAVSAKNIKGVISKERMMQATIQAFVPPRNSDV